MKFIEYKGRNVNLDLVTNMEKINIPFKAGGQCCIRFSHAAGNEDGTECTLWQFDTTEERDAVYEHAIQMTNFTQIVLK